MSKFRYDVVLRRGPRADVSWPDLVRKDAAEFEMDVDELRLLLAQERPDTILVQNVLNQRLVADIDVLQWLGDPSANGSVGDNAITYSLWHRRVASIRMKRGNLAKSLGYSVSVRWSAVEPDRRFDVLFHRADNGQTASSIHALATGQDAVARPWKEYANDPVRSAGQRIVVSEVRQMLAARLPAYMIPANVVCLERFPLTPNGKVNRAALPAPDVVAADERYIAPRTDVEQQLAEIWTEILDLPRVGVGDNFFELGGHSLLATQVISRIREKFSVELPIQSLFDAPQLGEFAARLASGGAGQRPVLPPICPVDRQTTALPLSFAQRRLWFLDQLQGADTTYNLFGAVELKGDLNAAALEEAFGEVVRRHEVLRTNFVEQDGNPAIVVSPPGNFALDIIPLENLADDSQALEVDKWIEAEAGRPFDLARDRLFRAILLRRNRNTHLLLMSMHHIVSDQWSLGVLIHELSTLYAAFEQGQPSPLPELSIQYADYAAWQQSWLADSVIKAQLEFWIDRLSGAPARLELPTDRPRPKIQRHHGRVRSFHLDRELADQVESLGRGSDATLFMTLLTAYAILLHRYTGATDLVIGSPIANRVRRELESLVGFFVNTLPLRIDLSGNPSVRELLARVGRTAVDAYSHQDVPFEQLVEELRPERNLGHAPIFQVMLVLQNAPAPDLGQTSLEISPVEPQAVAAKFDCTLSIEETANGLTGMIEYDTDLFDESTIDRMIGHFSNALRSMVERPADRVRELNLLGEDERRHLLVTLNDARLPAPEQPTVTHLFETQVRNTPDRPAVQVGDELIGYAALNDRANQLAAELKSFGVLPEVAVGIYLDRGMEAIASMHGDS